MIWIEFKPMIIQQTWMTKTDTSASYHSTISPIHTKEQIGVMKQEFFKATETPITRIKTRLG
jgi:hypothetical protein